MDDEMIKKFGENGGVIMINFGFSFVFKEVGKWCSGFIVVCKVLVEKEGEDSFKLENFEENYCKEVLYFYLIFDEVFDYIDYVVKLIGVDYVGIGLDYDGVGDLFFIGFKDVVSFLNLV